MRLWIPVAASSLLALAARAEDPSLARLEKSPRHHEWVQIKQRARTVHAFVAYPEVKGKATAVLVIHENRGLTDWVRSAADQFAEAGYLAIAPDLLSGAGPGGGKTSDFPSQDAASKAIYTLPPDQVTADLNAVADHITGNPASNGKLVVAGFCWGGAQTFRFATDRDSIAAAMVFYGTGPEDKAAIARIKAPVHGFYGGNDARVGATLDKTKALMKEAGKAFDPVSYEGAGHAFMRNGEAEGAKDADKKARAEAWARLKKLLEKL